MCGDRIIRVQHSQSRGCWCAGSFHRHGINTRDTDWLHRMDKFLSYMRNDFNYLCHVSVEEWYKLWIHFYVSYEKLLQWRHNERDGVSSHQPHDSRRRSKETSKLRVTGLCERNSPVTDEFPAQRVSNAENVSIWYRLMLARKYRLDWVKLLPFISLTPFCGFWPQWPP